MYSKEALTAGKEELGIIVFNMNPMLRFENIPLTIYLEFAKPSKLTRLLIIMPCTLNKLRH